jgi:histidyl-tRNA synthetase
VFEVVHPDLDVTIAAGGRYDGLIGMFGAQPVPATGGSLGIERILSLLPEDGQDDGIDAVVTVLDSSEPADLLALAGRLRGQGLAVEVAVGGGRLGRQLKHAEQRGARTALLRGAEEREAGTVTVKTLASGDQVTLPEAAVAAHVAATRSGHDRPGHGRPGPDEVPS